MKDSTFDFGPCYNPITPNGLPILGHWERPAEAYIAQSLRNPVETPLNAYITQSGNVIIKGISLDPSHDINFHFGYREDVPALLFQEDLDVAAILVFLDQLSHFPQFKLIQTEEQNLYKKEWEINWLQYTDFGRTLYTCHQYINALVFNLSSFSVCPEKDFFDPEWHAPILNMLGDMEYVITKSHIQKSMHEASMLISDFKSEEKGKIDNQNPLQNSWKIEIIDTLLSFKVYDVLTNQTCDPISSFLDYNADAFTQLMPVFERYRQLASLFHALTKLRDAGYLMPEEMIANYTKKKSCFLNLPMNSEGDSSCTLLPMS